MVDELVKNNLEEEEIELDQYLVFRTNSQEFGIQAMWVQEISSMLSITSVPTAPPYIEGIVNLRGRLVSIVNFRKKFGFEPKATDEDTRVIIVEHNSFPIGMVVDSVEEVIKIPDEKVQELLGAATTSVSQEYITGVGMLDDRLIVLLDVTKVLTRNEWTEVKGTFAEKADGKNSDAIKPSPRAV